MRRLVTTLVIIGAVCVGAMGVAATARAQTATCPVSAVRAAVAQACQCGAFRNRGQYMKCVRGQAHTLHHQGCDTTGVVRCGARSVCGKPHTPIVCCKKNGRPTVTSASKCTAKQGTVMTGVD